MSQIITIMVQKKGSSRAGEVGEFSFPGYNGEVSFANRMEAAMALWRIDRAFPQSSTHADNS